jgi:hypothetical protein
MGRLRNLKSLNYGLFNCSALFQLSDMESTINRSGNAAVAEMMKPLLENYLRKLYEIIFDRLFTAINFEDECGKIALLLQVRNFTACFITLE